MALAKKCDRCECHYQQKDVSIDGFPINGIITINRERDNRAYSTRTILDLCPKCLESFNHWLHANVEGGNDNESVSE